jgi:hypothetical protein
MTPDGICSEIESAERVTIFTPRISWPFLKTTSVAEARFPAITTRHNMAARQPDFPPSIPLLYGNTRRRRQTQSCSTESESIT